MAKKSFWGRLVEGFKAPNSSKGKQQKKKKRNETPRSERSINRSDVGRKSKGSSHTSNRNSNRETPRNERPVSRQVGSQQNKTRSTGTQRTTRSGAYRPNQVADLSERSVRMKSPTDRSGTGFKPKKHTKVENLTERATRRPTVNGKEVNTSINKAAAANKDFKKTAPKSIKKFSRGTSVAGDVVKYAGKDLVGTGLKMTAGVFDGPKKKQVANTDYKKFGDSLKNASKLKSGGTKYKPTNTTGMGYKRDSKGNLVTDVQYGAKAKSFQNKLNKEANKWEKSADKDVKDAVKGLSNKAKYDIPDLGPLNKIMGMESAKDQRKRARDEINKTYSAEWKKQKTAIAKEFDDYVASQGLSADSMLNIDGKTMSVAEYRNKYLKDAYKETLLAMKTQKAKDIKDTSNIGKISARDIGEMGIKGGVEMAEMLIPYGGSAKASLKAADLLMGAGKAAKAGSKAAKGAKVLTSIEKEGARALSADGKAFVRKAFKEGFANGKKTADIVDDITKQVVRSDLKQNIKREIIANALQDASIGATIDVASAKKQGLEGKDLAKYMAQSAAMNAVMGAPVAGIAGRTGRAGKTAIKSDIVRNVNDEFVSIGKLAPEKSRELFNLIQRRDNGVKLTTDEAKRLKTLQNEQITNRSGVVQIDAKGNIVVNDADVVKSVFSEPELKEYTKLRAREGAGLPISKSDAVRMQEIDGKIKYAYQAVEHNANSVIKLGEKNLSKIGRSNLESAVEYFKKTGETTKLNKAMKMLDKDIKNATERNEAITKAINTMTDRTGINYRLVSNDEMGKLVGGQKSTEGYLIRGEYRTVNKETGEVEIVINKDASQAHQTIIGHETGHLIKDNNEEEFLKLGDMLRDYAKKQDAKGYESFEKMMRESYPDLNDVDFNEEITCELLGRTIFGEDDAFIKRLAGENPTLLRRIVEYVKNLGQRIQHPELNAQLKAMTDKAEELIGEVKVEDVKANRAKLTETETQRAVSVDEDIPMKDLDKSGKIVEKDGEPVAEFDKDGSAKLSISSYDAEGRYQLKKYLNKLVKNKELSAKDADQMSNEIEKIYDICKKFADKVDENGNPVYAPFSQWSNARVIIDEKGRPVFSSVKKNAEYKMNIDFSTVCKKRRTLDAVFNEFARRGVFDNMFLSDMDSAGFVVKVNDIVRKHGFEAACEVCFVEARRYRQQKTATTFANMYNDLVKSMYPDESKISHFNYGEDANLVDVADGIHSMSNSELDLTHVREVASQGNTAQAKAARLLLKDPSQRKLLQVGDMMASKGFENMQVKNPALMKIYNAKKGTGGAKSSFGDVQYLNEIIRKKTFNRKAAYDVGGVRVQSFSDYVPRMVFDYVQMVGDLAAKKLPMHSYTKEPLFAKQFGLTGIKINMSLVPKFVDDGKFPGLDKNGNYAWNENGTFPYDEAIKIQNANGYSNNCGTIAVGVSDEHIRKMLSDPNIQMIIPYHKSSLNPVIAEMTNVDKFKNYEPVQTTRVAPGGKSVKNDFPFNEELYKLSHDKKGNLLPKEEWGDPRELSNRYLQWCDDHGYQPKFPEFRDHENYYKLLEDFGLYDGAGNFKPQHDVQIKFPTDEDEFGSMTSLIKSGLEEDAILEGKRQNDVSAIADEAINMAKEEGWLDNGAKFSKIGPNAKGVDTKAADLAVSLKKDGTPNAIIKKLTGWVVGQDGKPRFEISDKDFKIKGDVLTDYTTPLSQNAEKALQKQSDMLLEEVQGILQKENANGYKQSHVISAINAGYDEKTLREILEYNAKRQHFSADISPELLDAFNKAHKITDQLIKGGPGDKTLRLGDLIEHDKLFEFYPDAKNIKVELVDNLRGAEGQFDPKRNSISISLAKYKEASASEKESVLHDLEDTLIHEIQHYIQKEEGFESGASSHFWETVSRNTNSEINNIYNELAQKGIFNVATSPRVAAQQIEGALGKSTADRYLNLVKVAEKLGYKVSGEDITAPFGISFENYKKTLGEVEARDTSANRHKTQEELDKNIPSYVDNEDVLIKEEFADANAKVKFSKEKMPSEEDGIISAFKEKVPDAETIRAGDGEYMGFKIQYAPNDHAEAHNMGDYFIVSDKFLALDEAGRREVLAHEVAHNVAQNIENQYGFGELLDMEIFGKKKVGPKGSPKEGEPFYEGIFGDVGPNSLDESITDAVKYYIAYPEHLRKISPEAYDFIDNHYKKYGFSKESWTKSSNAEEPKVKFSIEKIVKDENGNTHENVVRLDTDVFDGLKTRKEKESKLHDFVYEHFAGNKFKAYDDDGNPVTIEFAREGESHKKIGAKRKQKTLDEIADKPSHGMRRVKTQKAAAQADELIEVSKFDRTSDANFHGKLDKNGWEYRTLKVMDGDGGINDCVLSIAKTEDGRNILYDIKIKNKIGQAVEAAKSDSPVSPISKDRVPEPSSEVKEKFSKQKPNDTDRAAGRDIDELRRLDAEGKLDEAGKAKLDRLETRLAESDVEAESGKRAISDQRTKFETLSDQKEDLERRLSELHDRINKSGRAYNNKLKNKAQARQEQYNQIEKQIAEIDDQLKTSPELRKLERDLRREQVYHLGPAVDKYGAESKQVAKINERIDSLKKQIIEQKAKEAEPPRKMPKRLTPKKETPNAEVPKVETPKKTPKYADELHKEAGVKSTPVADMTDEALKKEAKSLDYVINVRGKTPEHQKLRKERLKEINAELKARASGDASDYRPEGSKTPGDAPVRSKPEKNTPETKVKPVDYDVPAGNKVLDRSWLGDKTTSARRLIESSLVGFEQVANKTGNKQLANQINNVIMYRNRFSAWIEGSRTGLDRQITGDGLNKIYSDAGLFGKKNAAKKADFANYLTYKHAIDRLNADKPVHLDPETGMSRYTVEDYERFIKEIENNYSKDELKAFEKGIRGYYDDLMKMRVDAGLVSKEFADDLAKKYPHYVPTYREGDEWLKGVADNSGGKNLEIKQTIQTAKGGSQEIQDLYQQTFDLTREAIRNAEENRLMNMYVDAMSVKVDELPKGTNAKDVLDVAISATGNTKDGWRVSFFNDGKVYQMSADKQIVKGLREFNGQDYQRMINAASKMSGPMRAFKGLITDYNLIFGVRNGMRDFQQALVNSKDTTQFIKSMPSALEAIASKGNNAYFKLYEANGGKYSAFVYQDSKVLEPGSKTGVKKAADSTFGTALRKIEDINGAIELTPRLSEFIGTINKEADNILKKDGSSLKKMKQNLQKEMFPDAKNLTSKQLDDLETEFANRVVKMVGSDTVDAAMRNSADITLNFSRNGVIGKALNMGVVPYFNPSIQGLSKMVRMFTESKADGTLLNFGMKLGVITLAPAAVNEILMADNKDYQMLNTREKDTNYFIPLGDGKFIKLPKPRENAVLAEPVEYGLRFFFDHAQYGEVKKGEYLNKATWKQMFVSGWDNIGPTNPFSDNIYSPLIRLAQNKTWYGGSIESTAEVLQKKEGELKNSEISDETTSAIAKWIGETKVGGSTVSDITHMSPKKIDDFMDSYLGIIYDLGISQTSERSREEMSLKNNPITNQFIKDSVFSNKNGMELWSEFDKAMQPKTVKGKLVKGAKNALLGNSAWNIDEKNDAANDWLNYKGYDDITYSSGVATVRGYDDLSKAKKENIIRRIKRAQNDFRRDLVYGEKKVTPEKDPIRTFADIFGVDKAMKDFTFTHTNKETGEKTNQHLDAWKEYKKTDTYKKSDSSGKNFIDFYCDMRYTNGEIGVSKSQPSWMTASILAANKKGNNDDLGLSYIKPSWDDDNRTSAKEILQRGKNLASADFGQREHIREEKAIFTSGRKLGYDYRNELNPWDEAMSLATDKKYKFDDRNYYAADTSGKVSRRMNYARCLNEKGYSTKQIYDFAKEYDIKIPKTANMSKDQYVSTMKAFNAKVESAVRDKYGDKPLEEQAAIYHVITEDRYNKPFGDVGDYSMDSDTGITELDAKSSGGGYGYRRRRRRGYRRRHYRGHGGGGGGGSMPKTESGTYEGKITDAKVKKLTAKDLSLGHHFKAKVSNTSKTSNTSKPSNLNDAYRKRINKLMLENSKKLY